MKTKLQINLVKKNRLLILFFFIYVNSLIFTRDCTYAEDDHFSNYLIEEFTEPQLSIVNIEGKQINLKEYRGKFLILYFFASWCADCVNELKSLDEMKKDIKFFNYDEIEILPISIDPKSNQKIKNYYATLGIYNLSLYFDENKKIMTSLNIKSLPTTFFMDPNGQIFFRRDKRVDWSNKVVQNEFLSLVKQKIDQSTETNKPKTFITKPNDKVLFQKKDKSNNITIIN